MAKGWNQWRVANCGVKPDLCEAHLGDPILNWAFLNVANIVGAGLSIAQLREAIYCEAQLGEENLKEQRI